ncbi:hypothetical protein OH686_09080 [Pseudomonas sp. SO81]|jgi:cytosine/adenosine deaminase-related metal-dependent hydrolase|nr:hypothetical protein OH686_09080 [Pseudomonas sp. SO81]
MEGFFVKKTLIKGGQVISMAAGRPDSEHVDLLIENGRIAAIGADLEDQGAEVVDASGKIVMPGMINAHMHTWQTGLRGVAANWSLIEYVHWMHSELASKFTPHDIEIATLAGALNQINCGTTTLADWCHNNPTPDHTDAAIRGLRKSGIRAVYLHGTPHPHDESIDHSEVPHPASEIDRLLRTQFISDDDLLTLGMAILGPHYSTPEVAISDLQLAKDKGLIVSMHQSGGPARSVDGWDRVEAAGVLGPNVNVVHGTDLADDRLHRLVDLGVSFTVTPEIEMTVGHGYSITGRLQNLGTSPSLGIDIESCISGEMLVAARMALAQQRALDHEQARQETGLMAFPLSVTCKDALSWVTVQGAKALGLSDKVGSIEVGKLADLVLIDASPINLWPSHDAIATVLQASVANIDSVMVNGDWRKRHGKLVFGELDVLKSGLFESGARVISEVSFDV